MSTLIKSIRPGTRKRLGDYTFTLMWVRRVMKDTLYNIEVRFMGVDDGGNNNSNGSGGGSAGSGNNPYLTPVASTSMPGNESKKRRKARLILKSPVLLDAPHRNRNGRRERTEGAAE
jgi:hypothetical protein